MPAQAEEPETGGARRSLLISTSTRWRARALANRAHRAAVVFALARCSPSRPRGDQGSEPNATDVCAIVTRALRSCLAASAARGVVVLDRGGAPSPLVIHASFPQLSKHVSSSPLAPACRRPRTGAGRPSAVASLRSGTSTSGRMRGSSPTCTTSSRLLSVCASVDAICSLAGSIQGELRGCERYL